MSHPHSSHISPKSPCFFSSQIVGIDVNPKKFALAKTLGCDECYNPMDHKETPMQQLLVKESPTGFGFDYTFDCTGNVAVMRSALEAAHRGWGEVRRPPCPPPYPPPAVVYARAGQVFDRERCGECPTPSKLV